MKEVIQNLVQKYPELQKKEIIIDIINAHKELVKDKLFTIEDMKTAIQLAQNYTVDTQYDEYDVMHEILKHTHSKEMIIQSLLPKTEWNVTFDEQGKLKLI